MAADLLLAVGQHPHVHAQLARGGKVERRAQDGVEVALVVGHAAAESQPSRTSGSNGGLSQSSIGPGA